MTKVSLEIRQAGFCTASQHHALKGSERKTIRFYATFGLIHHPEQGYILFDTGYSMRFFEETKSLPYSLYAKTTAVVMTKEEEVASQLAQLGIKPEEVSYIIISHFHADHLGGLKDFPKARFICSRKAYESIRDKTGWSAVKRAFLPGHLPADFEQRVRLIDFVEGGQDAILGTLVDVFSDQTIKLCLLEGHARGQMGALINATGKKFFLVADAAWLKEHYETETLPHSIVRLFFDSWKEYKASLKKLRAFRLANPEVEMVACHCRETFEKLKGKKF